MIHKIMTCILQQLCTKQPECQPGGTSESSSDCAENKSPVSISDPSSQETNYPTHYHVEFNQILIIFMRECFTLWTKCNGCLNVHHCFYKNIVFIAFKRKIYIPMSN